MGWLPPKRPSGRGEVAEDPALWRAVFGMNESMPALPNEDALLRLALDLGAGDFGGPLSTDEHALLTRGAETRPVPDAADSARVAIASGADPLGDAFCSLRSAVTRRQSGAIYTPVALIRPMVDWCCASRLIG